MKIEVSNGEIADKLTIIEIKLEKIKDEAKLSNLKNEYEVVNQAMSTIMDKSHPLYRQLYEINTRLWAIEDHIRDLERAKDFGDDFVQTARSVYFINDDRSDVKRKINEETGSKLFEEKSYEEYK
jgi:predicted  nucleic acid-binding Zn-ribbon protein